MRYQSHLPNILLMLSVALGLASCDEDAAGPNGAEGRISATITDDPNAAGEQQAVMTSRTFVVNGQTEAAQFAGTISGEAAVEISVDGETWISLDSPQSFEVDAQASGSAATLHTEAEVPVDTYTRARLVLDGAETRISAGSTIGGVTLTADAVLTMGGADETVTVEVPLTSVSVDAEANTMLRFDLNAESWVTESVVDAGTVTDAELSGAVTAAAETDAS